MPKPDITQIKTPSRHYTTKNEHKFAMEQKAYLDQTNEILIEKSTEKWYDNSNLADVLLFLLPPIGLHFVLSQRR